MVNFRSIMKGAFLICFSLCMITLHAQQGEDSTVVKSNWSFNAMLYWSGTIHHMTAMPVFNATYKHLFLQTRYNYESKQTFSTFVGYVFSGDGNLTYNITPSAGFMFGKAKGFNPDLSIDLSYGSFSLSSELEYLVDVYHPKLNYLSTWNEFTFYPFDWLYAGVAVQRSRMFQSYSFLDVQRGAVVGGIMGKCTLMGYLFNFLSNKHDIFGMLALDVAF